MNATKTTGKQVLSYYLNQAKRYPKLLIPLLFAVPVTVLVNIYLPSLIAAHVLSKLSQRQFSDDIWASFGTLLVIYAALCFIGIFTWRVVDYFTWKIERLVQQDMAHQVFDKMVSQTADFHANNFGGSLVSQNSKLLGGYVRIADTTIYQAYPLVVGLVAASVILAPRAPLYVGLLLAFSVLFVTVSVIVSRPTRRLGAIHSQSESAQTGFLADAVSNVMAIKSFARSKYEHRRYETATNTTKHNLHKLSNAVSFQHTKMGFMNRGMLAITLPVAVLSVVKFKADIGTVFLILSYTSSLIDQLYSFSNNSLRAYTRAIGDATDMVNKLAETPSVLDPKNPETLRIERGEIAFNNVAFSHAGSDDAIFEKLNLHIKDGEKIGLVGHSGSGKTTLTRILLRFSDIDSGAITIDGQNIAKITQDDLHEQIAYVPQESQLFHRTIEENISYGKLDATAAEIYKAAERANAAEFIEHLQNGYDTLVGERGVKLSGGQRQRIAIARAMIKDAPILVLDEATSALDSESEVLIQDALWKLMENKTAIVIAHRLSTIQKMHRIIVLDNGTIVEQGSHQDLLNHKGVYAKLWAHQSGGFMEE